MSTIGGTVSLMKGHPSIRMDSEYVHAVVWNDSLHVECVFFMHNRGAATKVLMGFPCTSGGGAAVPFSWFRSWVDGRSVATREMPDSAYGDEESHRLWMVKEVTFSPNQTRCIRDEYVGETGSMVPDDRFFSYTLATGASWEGTIGVADIVVSLRGIPAASVKYVEPPATSTSAGEVRWHFSDLEPEPGSSISMSWPNRRGRAMNGAH